MIIKERDPGEHGDGDEITRSGVKAEQQMAHYLRRAFADNPEVLVLNDIRLEVEDTTKEVVQIDHLVIHRHGLVIIESKSVTGRIIVNEHMEWIRVWKNRDQGMPSPVHQARRQGDLLKKALNANSELLLDKILFGKLQKYFGNCPVEVLVAVSDQGIIERKTDVPELCKADQVPDRLKEIIQRHIKAGRLIGGNLSLNNNDGMMNISPEERQRIATFLADHHYPRRVRAPVRSPAPQPVTAPALAPQGGICPKCGEKLISRTAKKGTKAGQQFWGCSAFPKCRYTSNDAPVSASTV